MAEREGFEPSEPARVHLISNQARSAAPASLLMRRFYYVNSALCSDFTDYLVDRFC